MLSRGDPATASVSLEASEAPIIFSVGEHLLGEDSETKEEIVTGLMKSEGEFRGLSCAYSFCRLESLILYTVLIL